MSEISIKKKNKEILKRQTQTSSLSTMLILTPQWFLQLLSWLTEDDLSKTGIFSLHRRSRCFSNHSDEPYI